MNLLQDTFIVYDDFTCIGPFRTKCVEYKFCNLKYGILKTVVFTNSIIIQSYSLFLFECIDLIKQGKR